MKVLIVEDSQMTQRMIDLSLRKHGFSTILCYNGKEALDVLEKEREIGLILSDVIMPVMSGMELLKTVKEKKETRSIPFIIISRNNEIEIVRQSIILGCHDFVVKPLNPGLLMKKVRCILGESDPWHLMHGGTHYSYGE